MSQKETPVCRRGFIAAMKQLPEKSIQQVSDYASAVCQGKIPDHKGKKMSSPFYVAQVNDFRKVSRNTIRPLYPEFYELYKNVQGEPAEVDDYIIGIIDSEGEVHLCRPVPKN
jgi:hypothetical protein